jgi:hypothetical protein
MVKVNNIHYCTPFEIYKGECSNCKCIIDNLLKNRCPCCNNIFDNKFIAVIYTGQLDNLIFYEFRSDVNIKLLVDTNKKIVKKYAYGKYVCAYKFITIRQDSKGEFIEYV